MKLLRLLGALSPVHISLFSFFSGGKFVGKDGLGNKYYKGKPRKGYRREKRWVLYNGVPEASNIPPEWHGWLHYQTDTVPSEDNNPLRRPWQKPHTPNLTGTTGAYRPPGHLLSGGKRDKATGDYEAWTPEKD